MGFLAAFFAVLLLMTPATSIDLGGKPQGVANHPVNVGDAGDSSTSAE